MVEEDEACKDCTEDVAEAASALCIAAEDWEGARAELTPALKILTEVRNTWGRLVHLIWKTWWLSGTSCVAVNVQVNVKDTCS